MNLHKLKQDYPKMPIEIKNMISSEIEYHLSNKKESKLKKYKSIAAIFAVILLAGTTIYAADKLIEMYSKKTGNYSYETEIKNSQDNSTTGFALNEGEYLAIDLNYLPEPLVVSEEEKFTLIDPENPTPYYSYISFYELPESGETYTSEHTSVISTEELTIGGMPAVFYEKNAIVDQTNKYIYEVVCEEYNILIQMFFDDRIGKADAAKIIENMTFSTTTDSDAENIIDIFERPINPIISASNEQPETDYTATKEELYSFYSIGETFTIAGNENIAQKTVDVCVTDVQICDNINQLPRDFTEEFNYYGENLDLIDSNGDVLPNTLYFIKGGDGTTTLNETLETKVTDTKLVYVEVDYTNPNETYCISDLLFYCELYTLNDMGNYYELSQHSIKEEVAGCDYIDSNLNNATTEHLLYSNGVKPEDNNHILRIDPGETYTVYHLFIVQEDELDNMYIDLQLNNCAPYILERDNFNISMVNISQ